MSESFIKRGPSKLKLLKEELLRMEDERDYLKRGGASESQIYHLNGAIESLREQIQEEERKKWQNSQKNIENLKQMQMQNQQLTPEQFAAKGMELQ